jgi:hypothetical protein
MTPPTSIDGTEITGATIDGTEVQEITVDGNTVFTGLPDVPQNGNLVSVWPIDDNDSTVTDTVGPNDGTNVGGTFKPESTLDQDFALEILEDDFVSTPFDMGGFSDFSTSILVNLNVVDGSLQNFMAAGVGSGNSPMIFRSFQNVVQVGINSFSEQVNYPNSDLTVGDWQLHSFTFDGNNDMTIYLDGTKKDTINTSFSSLEPAPTSEPFYIGNSQTDTTRGTNGLVAQCLVWDAALTDAEHSDLATTFLP